MPQIAKANDDEMYAFYTNAILDNIISTKSPQIQSSVEFALDPERKWKLTEADGSVVDADICYLLQKSISKGNRPEIKLVKTVNYLDEGANNVDALGNSLSEIKGFAMDYEMFLVMKNGQELLIGSVERKYIALFQGLDELTITIGNLERKSGKNIVFAVSTDVVVK